MVYTHVCTRVYAHIKAHVYAHVYAHAYTHVRIHVYAHACSCVLPTDPEQAQGRAVSDEVLLIARPSSSDMHMSTHMAIHGARAAAGHYKRRSVADARLYTRQCPYQGACVYTHVYMHVCTHVCARVYTRVYAHIEPHVPTQVSLHVYTHVCAHVDTYACTCVLPTDPEQAQGRAVADEVQQPITNMPFPICHN